MKDVLRPYVPEYKGQVASDDGEREFFFISMLMSFIQPLENKVEHNM